MGVPLCQCMSELFSIVNNSACRQLVRHRPQEVKLGEEAEWYNAEQDLKQQLERSSARFVLLGIPEDIGVKANYGRGGAHTAFKPALESFLNQQSNAFLNGKTCFVLGELELHDLMHRAVLHSEQKDIHALRRLVSAIDERVTAIIKLCVECGKIPLIIGGGHNNAYGNVKGSSLALNTKINVINCDPHSDFRPLEGRHSGNGFSYAFEEGYLNRYSVFALHEQYNTYNALEAFQRNPERLMYQTYESIFVRETVPFRQALDRCLTFVKHSPCGVEMDIDAITNAPSSAKTSSGLSPVQARQYAYLCGLNLKTVYFHIAEAAPILSHIKADNKTGKLIAYLLSDFIKGVTERDELRLP